MSKYRDDLGAAHRRIETLSAQVAERDASIVARDLEIQELRSHIELIGDDTSSTREGTRLSGAFDGVRVPALFGVAVLGVTTLLEIGMAAGRDVELDAIALQQQAFAVEPLPGAMSNLPAAAFSHTAAAEALDGFGEAVFACRQHPDDPAGVARVQVTFGNDGRVSNVELDGAPFEETAVGECIIATFHQAQVPTFDGSPVTVVKPIVVE